MKQRLLLVGILALSACAPTPTLVGTTWQVTDVFSSADLPSTLPDDNATKVTISFGNSTIVGFSGCSQFTATANYKKDSAPALIDEATTVSFSDFSISPQDELVCTAKTRYIHDALQDILTTGPLEITRPQPASMVLREPLTASVEPRAIGLALP
ncbi:META domain-containing protein [Corynebacterium sp. ES2794-CONJ1]|uniref:META domain-containing protein n=1 Tax=Corynebacterium sp. ES2794-CONJ1 TaxID=2980553 RepID=UPI0021D88CB0|nr:META domain-containing protein [Corynebacterium sp. ES2794-CONJ1]MCU9519416.1 META domain-containing protein [Corynebacterium sp. ES2794-CONJ1]